jgi:4-amino-4-deoxy-L-arabinose transferase-like glycosyltransferase
MVPNVADIRSDSATVFKALIILTLAFIPRFFFIDETSMMGDEVLYVEVGRKYITGLLAQDFSYDLWSLNAGHPPVAKLLIGLTSSLLLPVLGDTVHNLYFSARLASVVVGTLLCLFVYLLGRRCFSEGSAFAASLMSATSPWVVYWSTIAMLDIFVAFFVTLSFLTLCYLRPSNKSHVLIGFFIGLALGSKGTAVGALTGLALYAMMSMLQDRRRGFQLNLRKVALRSSLVLLSAGLTFFAVWPWLWFDPLNRLMWTVARGVDHMVRGHETYYAGAAYLHVPSWVTPYILFVKNPAVVFLSTVVFTAHVLALVLRGKPVPKGHLVVFCWIVGGTLSLSALPILIGDNYVLFLAPAVCLSASMLAIDILGKAKKAKVRWLGIALILIMLAESVAGLAFCRVSPSAYVNELITDGDQAIIMMDTGYEDAAKYLIEHRSEPAVVASPYPDLLAIEFQRKGVDWFDVVDMKNARYADYAVVHVSHIRVFGMPRELEGFRLVHTVKAGTAILAYIFEAE